MMTCTIRLFTDTKITEKENFALDDIEEYLDSEEWSVENFQVQKPLFEMTIKLDLNQGNAYPDAGLGFCNFVDYIAIKPTGYLKGTTPVPNTAKIYYYFVTAKRWISSECVAFDLRMDVLNTFKFGTDYKATSRTLVEREHKDRMTELPSPKTVTVYQDKYETHEGSGSATYSDGLYRYHIAVEDLVDLTTIPYLYGNPYSVYPVKFKIIDSHGELDYSDFDEIVEESAEHDTSLSYIFDLSSYVDHGNITIQIYYFEIRVDMYMKRNVDLYPEGLTPVLFKKNEDILREEIDTSWNLAYYSDENDGIKCDLYPEEALKVSVPSSDLTIQASDLDSDYYLFYQKAHDLPVSYTDQMPVSAGNDSALFMEWSDGNYNVETKNPSVSILLTYVDYHVARVHKNGANLEVELGTFRITKVANVNSYFFRVSWSNTIITTSSIKFSNLASVKALKGSELATSGYDSDFTGAVAHTFTPVGTTYVSIPAFRDVDRFDSKLGKIIKLPYCPNTYTYDGETLDLGTLWKTDGLTGITSLDNLNSQFVNNITTASTNPLFNLLTNYHDGNPSLYAGYYLRNDDNESKLFHSDFYQPKFVYDSFTFVFQMEKIDVDTWVSLAKATFDFTFVTTSTINSKFLFEFPQYILKYSTEDYDNILCVSRNNEVTIYNNEYLNYLATAYNYDLKAKERTIKTATLSGILGGLGNIAGIGLGLASGNPSVKVSSVLGGTSGFIGNIISTINTIASAEEDFARKQDLLKAQSFSVSGSDDVDLLTYYSENRAKLCIYECSPRMKKALADLFYYCGYATNEQKVPDVSTRTIFNYLKCQLSINGVVMNEEVTNEIINKFNEGVTFIHECSPTIPLYERFTLENKEVSLDE